MTLVLIIYPVSTALLHLGISSHQSKKESDN